MDPKTKAFAQAYPDLIAHMAAQIMESKKINNWNDNEALQVMGMGLVANLIHLRDKLEMDDKQFAQSLVKAHLLTDQAIKRNRAEAYHE
ncbi:hypothetical protein [Ferrimonas balearica]|uniref:hypothetical protein n=1 Tax=Ferrimonas balearica TaxID=44012 RepID=UPI001F1AC0B7|nr:hypothetical protein [Ferrimonas balearica]MBY6093825.1 hypothetical protein [Ferrimonas balearica]